MQRLDENELKTIARRIKNSEQGAFDALFRKYYAPLVQMSYRYTRQKSSASDIVQDAFVKLWQMRSNIDPELSIVSYLYTIVRNLSLNYLRNRSKEQSGIDEEKIHAEQESYPVGEPEEDYNQKLALLKNWVSELPERQQMAFSLSRFEGLEHYEIATVMNISSRTVNNHITAALDNLKSRYEEYKTGMRSVHYG